MVFLIVAETGVLSTTQGLGKHPGCSSVLRLSPCAVWWGQTDTADAGSF